MAFSTGSFVVSLIASVIMIPLGGLLLMLSAKIFKLADQSYKSALKVAAIVGVAALVFTFIGSLSASLTFAMGILSFVLVSVLLALWLIKKTYSLEWGKAILVWLVWFVFSLIATFIIAAVVGVLLVALGLSMLSQTTAGLSA